MIQHYFEAHINVPLLQLNTDEREAMTHLARAYSFKMSDMNGNDPEQQSRKYETIFTGHSQHADALEVRMKNFMTQARAAGTQILRYKIEAAIVDSRIADVWGAL